MTPEIPSGWEAVIGLEVHCQLATESKLFCSCPVSYGDAPNHSTCPVCLALPGALPVLNRAAVQGAVRAALAAHCNVNPRSVFARKNYFYPDLPKGYQISQFEAPVASGGWIEIETDAGGPKRVALTRIHMEEDAGKSIHDASGMTHVDLNRAGVPLVEIVSEPELRTPEEAGAYLRALRAILRAVEVSDADMEKGQFRCDANVSVRRNGDTVLGTRTELKNLNSFRFVEEAVAAEIERQVSVIEEGGAIVQATLRYTPESGRIQVMRIKEDAHDYRYFPDPDLIPLVLDEADIERERGALPELPEDRRARFEADYGLAEKDARQLTADRALADFFEAAAREHGAARSVANWVLRDVLAALNERDLDLEKSAIEPSALAKLVALVDAGRVTARSARPLVAVLVESGGDPEALVAEGGLESVSDSGLLEGVADEVLAANPKAVEGYRGGDPKTLNFLMGQVMRKTQGKADPAQVRELLARKLED